MDLNTQLNAFLTACVYSQDQQEQPQTSEVVKSALELMTQMPSCQDAVLDQLQTIVKESTTAYFLQLNYSPALSEPVLNEINILCSSLETKLSSLVADNPLGWSGIIIQWCISLLGDMSSQYNNFTGCPLPQKTEDLVTFWNAVPLARMLINILKKSLHNLKRSKGQSFAGILVETATTYSSSFSWVLQLIGPVFPEDQVRSVVLYGLNMFAQSDLGMVNPSVFVPTFTIITNLLPSHRELLRQALLELLQESAAAPVESDVHSTTTQTVPYCMLIAAHSAALSNLVAEAVIESLKGDVVRDLMRHSTLWNLSTGASKQWYVNLVVYTLISIESAEHGVAIVKFLFKCAFGSDTQDSGSSSVPSAHVENQPSVATEDFEAACEQLVPKFRSNSPQLDDAAAILENLDLQTEGKDQPAASSAGMVADDPWRRPPIVEKSFDDLISPHSTVLQSVSASILVSLLQELKLAVYAADSKKSFNLLNGLGRHTEWMCRELIHQRETNLQYHITCRLLMLTCRCCTKNEAIDSMSYILRHSTRPFQLMAIKQLQEECEIRHGSFLDECLYSLVSLHTVTSRLLANLVQLIRVYASVDEGFSGSACLNRSLRAHVPRLLKLLESRSVSLATHVAELLTLIGSRGTRALHERPAAVHLVNYFFHLLTVTDMNNKKQSFAQCRRCIRTLCDGNTRLRRTLVEQLIKASAKSDHWHLFCSTLPNEEPSLKIELPEAMLLEENRTWSGSEIHSGVIGRKARATCEHSCEEHHVLNRMLYQNLLVDLITPSPQPSATPQAKSEEKAMKTSDNFPQLVAESLLDIHLEMDATGLGWPQKNTSENGLSGDDSAPVQLERDLKVLRIFEQQPLHWETFFLIATNKSAVEKCMPVLGRLLSILQSQWQRCLHASTGALKSRLDCTTNLVRLLAESGYIKPPLSFADILMPHITCQETAALLGVISTYIQDVHLSAGNSHPDASVQSTDEKYTWRLRGVLNAHIDKFGALYKQFFPVDLIDRVIPTLSGKERNRWAAVLKESDGQRHAGNASQAPVLLSSFGCFTAEEDPSSGAKSEPTDTPMSPDLIMDMTASMSDDNTQENTHEGLTVDQQGLTVKGRAASTLMGLFNAGASVTMDAWKKDSTVAS